MIIFDGRAKASEIEESLRGRSPKTLRTLHSIVVGDEQGVMTYQKMKQSAAERVGAKLVIEQFGKDVGIETLKSKIENLNSNFDVHGIMVQLPLPEDLPAQAGLRQKTEDLISTIIPTKDIDGMREDSPFIAPVAKAVLIALEEANHTRVKPLIQGFNPISNRKTLVVGSSGFVGEKLVRHLTQAGYIVIGVDDTSFIDPYTLSADIIISATGVPALIGPDQIRQGVVLIDVGAPVGDISREAYDKASFVSPVPGGIGPVTIACLIENLVNLEIGNSNSHA